MADLLAVFDLDGTLIDSDAALVAPFVALGVPEEDITFGHTLGDECARLGIAVADYLAAYDPNQAQPFPGAEELVAALPQWAVCSNKHPESGVAELDRLGWKPRPALFADAFGGASKRLGPVLELLGVAATEIVFVGDTAHDLRCATEVGCRFVWAGWNPRVDPGALNGQLLARTPLEVLEFLAR